VPEIGRIFHMPPMGLCGACSHSAGGGAPQGSRFQTAPGAFSVLRSNWQVARPALTPPEMNSASITLIR
jgi:hypothetical protein